MARYGFVSTYPPTRCGLATFTAALVQAMVRTGIDEAVVVRVDDLVPSGPAVPSHGVRQVGYLHPEDPRSRVAAVERLNECDLVIVQHEYGIYGGRDGEEVIALLAGILPTKIVVLHTVLSEPSPHQREVLQQVVDSADQVVVMTRKAQAIIAEQYLVPESRLSLIPHGVDPWRPAAPIIRASARPVVLTWGLIGPGKGIEWGIRAMACLGDFAPRPIYRVLGQTHPKVLRDEGDRYRLSLEELARHLGVSEDVEIDGRYQESTQLAKQVAGADLVLLAYDSKDQATSGVLAEAVAAGKVVIATRFPHAVELLSGGEGILVGHQRPLEIANAIRESLATPLWAAAAAARSRETASANSWANTADRYRALTTADAVPA